MWRRLAAGVAWGSDRLGSVEVGGWSMTGSLCLSGGTAAVVLQALSEPNPKRRYMITPNQREAEITIRKAIEVLVQLNEGQPYTYDRDALVNMLDESLATARPRTPAPMYVPLGVKARLCSKNEWFDTRSKITS